MSSFGEKLVDFINKSSFLACFKVHSVHVMFTIVPHNLFGVDTTNLTEVIVHLVGKLRQTRSHRVD